MITTKLAPIAVALTVAFTGSAQADCMYYGVNNSIESASANRSELLGKNISIIHGYDEDTAHDIGNLMHFECLYNIDSTSGIITLRDRGEERTPRNIENIPAIHRLTRVLSISISFDKQDALMTANVSCEQGILLKFDPDRFLKIAEGRNAQSQNFQETVLSLLGNIAQRANTNAMGHYQISAPMGPVYFLENKNGPNCAAQIS